MPPEAEHRIDATDVKILTLLQEDGRRSYTSMAEAPGRLRGECAPTD